jgi:hypothetical protein
MEAKLKIDRPISELAVDEDGWTRLRHLAMHEGKPVGLLEAEEQALQRLREIARRRALRLQCRLAGLLRDDMAAGQYTVTGHHQGGLVQIPPASIAAMELDLAEGCLTGGGDLRFDGVTLGPPQTAPPAAIRETPEAIALRVRRNGGDATGAAAEVWFGYREITNANLARAVPSGRTTQAMDSRSLEQRGRRLKRSVEERFPGFPKGYKNARE